MGRSNLGGKAARAAGKIWNYFQNLEDDWKKLTFLRLEEIYISNWKKTDNKTQFLETEKLENNNLDYVSLKKYGL